MEPSSYRNSGRVSPSPTIGHGRSYLSLVLDVPREVREDVTRWRDAHCTTHEASVHITVFITELGDRPEEKAELFLGKLRRLVGQFGTGTITLVGTGTFRPMSDVVFLSVGEGDQLLRSLHEQCLTLGDSASPFLYHPHMTLVQDEPRRTLESALADFRDYWATVPVHALKAYIGDVTGWRPAGTVPLG